MATKFPDLFAALAAPFDESELRHRQGSQGRRLTYVTERVVANRLDSVLGPECWEYLLEPWGPDALIGKLTVTLPDGSRIVKSSVGGKAAMGVNDDDAKSADSDCMKRCAAKLGVGRYLYNDGVPDFAEAASPPRQRAQEGPQRAPQRNGGPVEHDYPARGPQPPRTGGALFAFCKEQGQKANVKLLDAVIAWGKERGHPDRIVDWDDSQVSHGHSQAIHFLEHGIDAPASARHGSASPVMEEGDIPFDPARLLAPKLEPRTPGPWKWLQDMQHVFELGFVNSWREEAKRRGWTFKTDELTAAQLDEFRAWAWSKVEAHPESKAKLDRLHAARDARRGPEDPTLPALRAKLFDLALRCTAARGYPDCAKESLKYQPQIKETLGFLSQTYGDGSQVLETVKGCTDAALLRHCVAKAEQELEDIEALSN
jgi:hypothetical protein